MSLTLHSHRHSRVWAVQHGRSNIKTKVAHLEMLVLIPWPLAELWFKAKRLNSPAKSPPVSPKALPMVYLDWLSAASTLVSCFRWHNAIKNRYWSLFYVQFPQPNRKPSSTTPSHRSAKPSSLLTSNTTPLVPMTLVLSTTASTLARSPTPM